MAANLDNESTKSTDRESRKSVHEDPETGSNLAVNGTGGEDDSKKDTDQNEGSTEKDNNAGEEPVDDQDKMTSGKKDDVDGPVGDQNEATAETLNVDVSVTSAEDQINEVTTEKMTADEPEDDQTKVTTVRKDGSKVEGKHVRVSLESEIKRIPNDDDEDDLVQAEENLEELGMEDTATEPEPEPEPEPELEPEPEPELEPEPEPVKVDRGSSMSLTEMMKLFKLDQIQKSKELEVDENFLEPLSISEDQRKSEDRQRPSVFLVREEDRASSIYSTQLSADFVLESRRKSEAFSLSSTEKKNLGMIEEEKISVEEKQEQPEEEEPQPEEPPEIQIDRNLYYEMYSVFLEKKRCQKTMNNILQTKTVSYFIRRKMYYVLKSQPGESVSKYERDLDSLGELLEKYEQNKMLLTDEIRRLRIKRDAQIIEIDQLFQKLQRAEQDFAKTLTFERTGRTNMDKVVERFLKRQKIQTALLSELRLEYIHLRNKIADALKALDDLDRLGPGYRIMDYVQLKQDNRILHDRLEEKECELTSLRLSCNNTMQILAHTREKNAIIEQDIAKKMEEVQAAELDVMDAREQVHFLKNERKQVREDTIALRVANGLLTYPEILQDMETCEQEVNCLQKELEYLINHCREATENTAILRKNLEKVIQIKRAEEQEKNQPTKFSSFTTLVPSSLNTRNPDLTVKKFNR